MSQQIESRLRRAERVLRDQEIADVVERLRVRAIIGPEHIPNSEVEAQQALSLMREGKTPSAVQLEALEIVIRMMRPVLFSKRGELEDLPRDDRDLYTQEDRDAWRDFRVVVRPLLYSVGRIELGTQHKGTGFVVGDGLVATNRHVLAALTSGSEVLRPGAARIVFKQEVGEANPKTQVAIIDEVAAIHPKLDIVLLRTTTGDRPPVEVSTTVAAEGARVVVIGYPAEDPVNNPLFLSGVFQGKFGVKRAALGEVLDGSETPTLFHDCSTTQGNSGSPIFDLVSARVIGIHRAGFFMYRNEGVDAVALHAFISGAR